MDAMTITAAEQQLVISITRGSDMPDCRVPISLARAKSASLIESRCLFRGGCLNSAWRAAVAESSLGCARLPESFDLRQYIDGKN
jgi:hypothetical protein